eukprot:CAMPEP_0170483402 /NCGR_PEP_ID=MMETSP0208-20121228/3082_1 /TAXON_ID=197538 /ORGANISM="Strombidium inclinatum, Strain S3" /LENGTH=256 /DNA_ID=CAMNT_0010756419 /DNA_START=1406 /DNA_END=2176 /DNA_ORIENTATION=+
MLYGQFKKSADVNVDQDALFSLDIEGIYSNEASNYITDASLQSGGNCEANVVNFKNFEAEPTMPALTDAESEAPFSVTLKNLVNAFGVLSDSSGDNLIMEVYSDYLRSVITWKDLSFPNAKTHHNFDDYKVPCREFLVVKLLEDDGSARDEEASVRINCRYQQGIQASNFYLHDIDFTLTGDLSDNDNYAFDLPDFTKYQWTKDGPSNTELRKIWDSTVAEYTISSISFSSFISTSLSSDGNPSVYSLTFEVERVD